MRVNFYFLTLSLSFYTDPNILDESANLAKWHIDNKV
jgi:hypothetical protein